MGGVWDSMERLVKDDFMVWPTLNMGDTITAEPAVRQLPVTGTQAYLTRRYSVTDYEGIVTIASSSSRQELRARKAM